jgi:glycerol uptake facilitator-like aquaporin
MSLTSTSFANPAVAIARAFTNTFSGIRPADLTGFIAAEFLGALAALAFAGWLLQAPATLAHRIRNLNRRGSLETNANATGRHYLEQ